MTTTGAGALDVFATNSGEQIFGRSQFSFPNGGDGGRWSAWGMMDGTLSGIAAESNADGRIELVGVDGGGALYVRQQIQPGGGSWTPWLTLYSP